MTGRRLLDLAALFNASRGVIHNHVSLRSKQLEVYSQTSTLALAVRNQTNRITKTIKAGSILASRLNEDGPVWTSDKFSRSTKEEPTTSQKSAVGPPRSPTALIDQDHFYKRPTGDSAVDRLPVGEFDIRQEKADRYPSPDGTIPPTKFDLEAQTIDKEVFSDCAQHGMLKKPLDTHGMKQVSSNKSTISIPTMGLNPENEKVRPLRSEAYLPSSSTANAPRYSAADSLSEGHDQDNFYQHSPQTSPTLASRVKLPIYASNVQERDAHLSAGTVFPDSFYSAGRPEASYFPEEDEIPEGVNTDLFHSPRIARILGVKTQSRRSDRLRLKETTDTQGDTASQVDHSQHTINVHTPYEKRKDVDSGVLEAGSTQLQSHEEENDVVELGYNVSKRVRYAHLGYNYC